MSNHNYDSPNSTSWTIKHINGELLASDLKIEQVDAWWEQNDYKYFGVKLESSPNVIVVDFYQA